MKLILLEDVKKVGSRGDIVTVKSGFARNFLLPQGLGTPFSQKRYEFFERQKAVQKEKYEETLAENEELATRLNDCSIKLSVQASEDGKLYGSVTSMEIQEALEKEGFKIDKKMISVDEPIKKLGVYQIDIQLLPEVTATVKVSVVSS